MIKLNKEFLAGAVVGFGAGLAAKALPNNGEGFLRNATKSAMKWGVLAAGTLKRQTLTLKETLEDISAEAKSEVNASEKASVQNLATTEIKDTKATVKVKESKAKGKSHATA